MSLDVSLTAVVRTEVFEANITHNLNTMAEAAGIYQHLWRPEELGLKTAGELIAPLGIALGALKSDPERFKKHNPPNGWGTYEGFVEWVEKYLQACIAHPDAEISVWR